MEYAGNNCFGVEDADAIIKTATDKLVAMGLEKVEVNIKLGLGEFPDRLKAIFINIGKLSVSTDRYPVMTAYELFLDDESGFNEVVAVIEAL